MGRTRHRGVQLNPRQGRGQALTARRALAALFAATLIGCGAQGGVDEHTIVLASAPHVMSARVAELLEDALTVSDVCAPVRVSQCSLDEAAAFAGHARAVIAFVGDRSLLASVDPARRPAQADGLIDRRVDETELLALVDRLHDGGALVATVPLGHAAHVEIPELARVSRRLRADNLIDVDAQATFDELLDRELFVHGDDRLDVFGEETLARWLFTSIVDGDIDIPARNDAERAARLEARALHAFVHDGEAWPDAVRAAIDVDAPPASVRHAARRAALRSARDGWNGGAAYADIEPSPDDPDAPGLAVALALANRPAAGWQPSDPVEATLLTALPHLEARDVDAALEALDACVASHPHRLDAWLGLQLVLLATPHPKRIRGRVIRALELHVDGAISPDDARRIAVPWPARSLSILPALIAAQRPFAAHRPSGPWLDDARRRVRFGFNDSAANRLQAALDTWRDVHPVAHELLAELR